ncbi:MAG: glutamate--tRNA ligase [Patescibacteria group bacterium]|nr:MAG: glutamate--tRNA ligase [Patescibacteria group bacterium]
MAPSPTGEMHVGSLSISLKNYAFAKRHGGQFILRIEDTDKTREIENGVELIQDILKKYGITWDEGPGVGGDHGPYIQSQRLDMYKKYAEQLVSEKKAYYCFCTTERLEKLRDSQREQKIPPKYDSHCKSLSADEIKQRIESNEPHVIRLAVPQNREITFTDLIRGDISFNSSTVDDQVLLKSDGYPTYHMAVVVDDHLMDITHIMRGEEWISSTPKHILLYQAFGWELPQFAHIPVYLNPDGQGKMSKRKGHVSAQSFLDRGYLPEAMLNFFMILGWAREDEIEIMTLDEYVKAFDPKDVSQKSVVFDIKKLNWINGVYIRKLTVEQLLEKITPFLPNDFPTQKLSIILPLIHERLETLADIEQLTSFFYRDISVDTQLLLKKSSVTEVKQQLEATLSVLQAIEPKNWNVATIEIAVRELAEKNNWKPGQYFMMLRLAATGSKATPPLFDTLYVVGKELMLQRLAAALKLI